MGALKPANCDVKFLSTIDLCLFLLEREMLKTNNLHLEKICDFFSTISLKHSAE